MRQGMIEEVTPSSSCVHSTIPNYSHKVSLLSQINKFSMKGIVENVKRIWLQ